MDYCSSCRRHLNGALVCPGCGAYAPDIAPVAVTRDTVQPRVTLAAGSAAAATAPVWEPDPGPAADTAPDDGPGPDPDPYDGLGGAESLPQGRAARRRQRVRWKKNQRRAVVATAVALVGGGLTFTALERFGGDRAEAASAPEAADPTGERASRDDGPPSARPDAGRSPADTAPRSPAGDGRPDRRTAADPESLVPQDSRPDTAPAPDEASAASGSGARNGSAAAAASSRRSSSSSSSSSESGAGSSSSAPSTDPGAGAPSSQQPSAPADTGSTGGTGGSGNSGGSEQGTSPADVPPAATSPSQLCLLVVCIG
ncbi:SCO2400 family protein [Streptomyces apricus]|uniref:Uncharacterized protein n=1 Tax=Streptomyces apricus TaxID=1828112 RepID=A0A5B0BDT6_9ACTN|nr:hypothetical protein [Streptomyces apricus]KAA0940200.1 hypothetical protein FGF04_10920 [Streptomyces apricus]